MKNVRLKKLELTNYRNIEFAILNFDGDSKIIGENRIGKTNALESIYWLLTDKLLDGSSDVAAIKPLKDTTLEVRVKATFDIDGQEVTLEKDYKENWVKTRGTTDTEMKGHVMNWIHNGVKQSTLKAYNQLVSEDFGFTQDATTKIDFMQMLINPFYLGNIGESKDWTELRAFIIKLVGDVSDEDVAALNPSFAIVGKDLSSVGGRVDQLKKKYSGDIDGLKTSIISDDAQIKLLEETLCPTDDEVAIAKKGIEEHQDKINALKSNNGLDIASMDISHKISDKKLELSALEKEDLMKAQGGSARTITNNELNELRRKQSDLLAEKNELQDVLSRHQRALRKDELYLEDAQSHRSRLYESIDTLDDAIANPKVESECPLCHRPYDEADVEKAKQLLIVSAKSKKESVIAEGKKVRAEMTRLEDDIIQQKAKIDECNNSLKGLDDSLFNIAQQIIALEDKLTNLSTVIEPNPQIAVLKEEISKLEKEYQISKENYSKGIQNNQQLIFDEEQAMIPFKKVLADKEHFERQMIQLEQVKKWKEEHSKALADVEQKKELLNQFIYTKLKMLDENVSRVFGNIKFQLIKENINGGFDTICKPYIYDVVKDESTSTTWKSGSKSERVVTGIAIAEKIKEKLNLPNLPFLFDEGGEISADTLLTRFKTDSQLICVKIADNIMSPLVQKL